jgi:hypothetical protein
MYEFMTELASIHSTLKPEPLAPTFVNELTTTHDSLATPPADLEYLGCHLDTWRQWAREGIQLHGKELPPDDPVTCPISLFRTLDYGRLEKAHTATLAWLLDPLNKEHGFGDKLLGAFLAHLIAPQRFDNLRVEGVEKEVVIRSGNRSGRLDVLAVGEWKSAETGSNKWMLVIEAKVDACERDDQLGLYDGWLCKHRDNYHLIPVFLTPDGRAAKTSKAEWEPLSFRELVQTFRKVYDKLRDAPGFHFLRFYLAGVLQDVCGLPRNFKLEEDCDDPYFLLSYLRTAKHLI